MESETPIPFKYGSDLHWLWGWGERLRSRLSDGLPTSEHDWTVFRPDSLARDAMMRFSIKYPHVIKQIDDYLDFADARFEAFLSDDNDSTRARFAAAMESLCERIGVGVETIAQSEGVPGRPAPLAGEQSSSRRDDQSRSEGANADRPDLEQGSPRHRRRGEVFISYSHKDKQWLDHLQTHLKPLLRNGSMTAWSDDQIKTGSKWFSAIMTALSRASVAVLLVTPDFLASDFICEHELAPILKNAERDGVRIVWIPVKACSYDKTSLKDYQAVIAPDRPLAAMRAKRDEAWVKICREIEKAANGE
jgi:hypothetical protein